MVLEAVHRAIDQNVKRWKYISGILSNWQKSHVKTMADVMQLDETYKNQKGGGEHATRGRRNGGNYQAGRSYEEESCKPRTKHAKLHQTRISAQHARIRKSCFTRK